MNQTKIFNGKTVTVWLKDEKRRPTSVNLPELTARPISRYSLEKSYHPDRNGDKPQDPNISVYSKPIPRIRRGKNQLRERDRKFARLKEFKAQEMIQFRDEFILIDAHRHHLVKTADCLNILDLMQRKMKDKEEKVITIPKLYEQNSFFEKIQKSDNVQFLKKKRDKSMQLPRLI
jgi:hypothetical protein